MRPNYDSDLYCKICNITLLYPEKFYVHSFQHLQDNMDFIMNKTTLQQIDGTTESIVDEKTCTQRMDTELPSQEEGIRRKRSVQEDGANRGKSIEIFTKCDALTLSCNKSHVGTYDRSVPKTCEPSLTGSPIVLNSRQRTNKSEKLNVEKSDLFQNSIVASFQGRNATKSSKINNIRRNYTPAPLPLNRFMNKSAFDSRRNKISSWIFNSRQFQLKWNSNMQRLVGFNKSRIFLNVTDRSLKEKLLRDLHVYSNEEPASLMQFQTLGKNITKPKLTSRTSRFDPKMVAHIKQAALWAQQKERKRDPETELVVMVRLNKKQYISDLLRQQQFKLRSLERYLERTSSDIYRYAVVNNTIVNSTKVQPFIITRSPYRTLPDCFRTGYVPHVRQFERYTNTTRWIRNYTSTYYVNRNLYRNYNYASNNYLNILDSYMRKVNGSRTNSQRNTTSPYYGSRTSHLNFGRFGNQLDKCILNPRIQMYARGSTKSSYINRNLYKYLNKTTANILDEYNMWRKNRSERYVGQISPGGSRRKRNTAIGDPPVISNLNSKRVAIDVAPIETKTYDLLDTIGTGETVSIYIN